MTSLKHDNFYWAGAIILLALAMRFFWLILLQNQIGFDSVRFLWISEHVMRGDYKLLPQLFMTPLLPGVIGFIAKFTGNPLDSGRIIGILGNTLAVGIAMLLIRRLFPQRPWLAWLTGLGLAVNHAWCRLSVIILAENFFYPLALLLLLLFHQQLERPTWRQGLAFGAVWALLFFARDIGLYCGLMVFLFLAGIQIWQKASWKNRVAALLRVSASIPVLAIFLGLWMWWFYCSFGIFSWGEGPRFYGHYTYNYERNSDFRRYQNGGCGLFEHRPYEFMEYSRFPKPGDRRYPPAPSFNMILNPNKIPYNVWSNFLFGLREFQRVSIIGFVTIFMVIPLGLVKKLIVLEKSVFFVFLAHCGIVSIHLLGAAWDVRTFASFFIWLYLGLAATSIWLWRFVQEQSFLRRFPTFFRSLIVIVFLFTLLFPQYFREVPQRWRYRHELHTHQLAASFILKHYGPQTIISSFGLEVAYRANAFWIGQPNGSASDQVEWLYLGGADFLLIDNSYQTTLPPNIFWDNPEDIQKKFPELNLLMEFSDLTNNTPVSKTRLFRFQPQPEKFAALKAKYPWAGTHPRDVEAMSGPPAKP